MKNVTFLPVHTLKNAHTDTISSLAFSSSGNYLASGGEDAQVIIWDTDKGISVARVTLQSPVISLLWDVCRGTGLFCGCQDGTLLLFSDIRTNKELKHEVLIGVQAPVYFLHMHHLSRDLAIAVGCEVHVAKELFEGTYATYSILPAPRAINSEPLNDTRIRARAVHFLEDARQLVVAYLNHGVVAWDIHKREALWQIVPAHSHQHIGHATISPDYRFVLLSNMNNGVDLYPFGYSEPCQTYRYTPVQERNFPFTVAFVGRGNGVVCGSPTGKVVVWDTKTGDRLQTLTHGGAMVQTITSFQARTFSFIATCPAGMGPETYIKIWKASMDPSTFNWLDWLSQQASVEGEDGAYIAAKFILSVLFIILAIHTTSTLWSLHNSTSVHLDIIQSTWKCAKRLVHHHWWQHSNRFWAMLSRFLRAVVEWTDLPQNAPEILYM